MTEIPYPSGPPPGGPSAPSTDEALLTASLRRPELFEQIFERHAVAIHRFLSRRVGHLADDLLSEAFLIAFRRRADYRPERSDVRPWLYGIATNLMRQHERQEAARYRALARAAVHEGADLSGADLSHVDEVIRRVDAVGLRARLATALADLQPGDREVLVLAAWADLSYAEIAAAMDIPLGTVRSRLHRARQKVRASLADPAPAEPAPPASSGGGGLRRVSSLTPGIYTPREPR